MSHYSNDLLSQARHLAGRDKSRPQQANLRRAVSAAYYGVFHLLCEDAAGIFIGKGPKNAKMRQLMMRAFIHTQMREACDIVLSSNPSPLFREQFALLNPLASVELQRLAQAFKELQLQRHRADYDLSNSFTRAEVIPLLDLAEQARDDWNTLKRHNYELARFFSLLLLLRGSLNARR
ncbi:hypothetical protein IAD21_03488 [Abditibacteriota bacterium]|nr:hypothetical protein IAD21_03488 [Abditibacteriota bacterium]